MPDSRFEDDHIDPDRAERERQKRPDDRADVDFRRGRNDDRRDDRRRSYEDDDRPRSRRDEDDRPRDRYDDDDRPRRRAYDDDRYDEYDDDRYDRPRYSRRAAEDFARQYKVAAGVCGILIGGFGVHKFILGFTVAGILQILLTLITCGIGSILGLIEGIIYLTKSDEDFYEDYAIRRREWF